MLSNNDTSGDIRHESSCEMIQEIYGFGAYYLLREDEEQLFQRLVTKYQHRGSGSRDEAKFQLSIRRAISRRKADLAIGTFRAGPARKESLISAPKGTADKDVADSFRVSRKIHLG